MRPQRRVTWDDVRKLVKRLVYQGAVLKADRVYGVPSGGVPVALLLSEHSGQLMVDQVATAANTLVADDIIDSGKTMEPYLAAGCTTAALFGRPGIDPRHIIAERTDDWIEFPWEHKATGEDVVTRMIELIGDDPNRPGLVETPRRVLKAWQEMYGGYQMQVPLATFDDACDELVICRDIAYYSSCEHHMLPFFGQVHIGYLPDQRVLGLSKLSRLVDKFSRRLQVQERLTVQIADAVQEATGARGVAVVVEGTHFCMRARGVKQQDSIMTTSAMLGRLRESPPTRAEFMALIGK